MKNLLLLIMAIFMCQPLEGGMIDKVFEDNFKLKPEQQLFLQIMQKNKCQCAGYTTQDKRYGYLQQRTLSEHNETVTNKEENINCEGTLDES